MAKFIYTNYVFDASAKTVVFTDWFGGSLQQKFILLITNVVDGIIIYSFADPSKGGTLTPDVGGDILTLEYDTTSMSDTDELQIQFDDAEYPTTYDQASDIVLNTQVAADNTGAITNQLPATIGQKAKAASLAVTLASDEDAIPVDINSGTVTANAGTNLNTSALALEAGNLASIKTAVEVIDNFISGARGLVTEDNSAAIKTAVETIDNFISGSRGLVTEDNSAAIKTSVELIDDAIKTDDAAFTPATDKVMMIGAQFDDASPDSVNEGDAGAVRMSANRSQYVNIRDNAGNERGLNIDANGAMAATVTNATAANLNMTEASAAAILAKLTAGATTMVKLEDVASADADAGTPAMAVRKATPANTSGTDGDYEFLQMSAGRLWASAVIDTALPAGTALIGKVGIDQTTPGTTNGVAAAGDIAHDAADSGSPVKVGAKAANALPTAVANNDRTNNISDLFGRQLFSHIDPAMQVAITKTAYNTTSTATGAAMWTPVGGKRIALTSLTIGTYGTTAARVIIWFGGSGDTTYTAGTDQAVVAASFAPSATVKPGLVFTPSVPIFCVTADNILRITTDAGISIDVTWSGYEF